MKRATIALLGLLLATAAGAQPLPVGTGLMAVEERLKAASDCESYRRTTVVAFSVFPNGTFELQNDAGVFRGSVFPADPRGRSWKLFFDAPSLHFYRLYLEAGVRALCGRDVVFEDGGVESFVLRPGTRGQASLRLNASGGSSALGKGRARHLIRGKGPLALPPLPTGVGIDGTLAQRRGSATVTMISPSSLEAAAYLDLGSDPPGAAD